MWVHAAAQTGLVRRAGWEQMLLILQGSRDVMYLHKAAAWVCFVTPWHCVCSEIAEF